MKQAGVTFSEMEDCDWLRSTFSDPLLSVMDRPSIKKKPTTHILKQQENNLQNYNLFCH